MTCYWAGGRELLAELSLCYSIAYHCDGAQWYKQFLQVGRLDWSLILLGLVALCLPSIPVSSAFVVLYIFQFLGYILYFIFSGIGP